MWSIRPVLTCISGFCCMKRLLVSYSLLDGMPVHRKVTPSIKFAERGTTQWPQPWLEPGPFDLEISGLTMRPPRLLLVLVLSFKHFQLAFQTSHSLGITNNLLRSSYQWISSGIAQSKQITPVVLFDSQVILYSFGFVAHQFFFLICLIFFC